MAEGEDQLAMSSPGESFSESEEVSEMSRPGPSKKQKVFTIRKYQGAATYKTKFKKEWILSYPFIKEVQGDVYSFFCSICGRNVRCCHMGRADIERHVSKPMHQANAQSRKHNLLFPFRASPVLSQKR